MRVINTIIEVMLLIRTDIHAFNIIKIIIICIMTFGNQNFQIDCETRL